MTSLLSFRNWHRGTLPHWKLWWAPVW